ncbi:MAG: DUF3592 domain-containing protein [Bacteroidales bacterium]|nr:DUF3592 domain-containing protein [Bacteroidales bacterium]
MKKNSFVILGIVAFIFIGIVVYGVFNRKNKLDKFRKDGIEVTATINNLYKEKNKEVSGSKKYDSYLEVTFFTKTENLDENEEQKTIGKDENGEYQLNLGDTGKDGKYVNTKIWVESSIYKKFKKGDKVQIFYLPNDPNQAILKETIEK